MIQKQSDDRPQEIENFVPKGAVVFFLLVILTMSSIWLFVYFRMIMQA